MEKTLEDRIRERAYFLWLGAGKVPDPTYFWLVAEREVMAAIENDAAPKLTDANGESEALPAARRVNALVLLDSGESPEDSDLGLAAE